LLAQNAKVCYNKFLRKQKMQTATKQKIDSLMLQLQDVLEDEYSENDSIQDAFNALAIVLDDVVA
jgi:protein-arginine kinase activator protein McsA